MAKALIYSSIYDQTAQAFVERVDEIAAIDGESLDVKINCNGGNPEQGWGMVSAYNSFAGTKSVHADGKAYSMGLFFLIYTPKESTSCLDVTQGLLHRASYGEWWENSQYFTDAQKTNLANINEKLMEATKNRINVKKLEAIMDTKPETKGKKFKDIWSMDSRLDVFLNAKELKEIELVGKVISITPKKVSSINARVMECAAFYQGGHTDMLLPEVAAELPKPTESSNNEKNNDMTPEEVQNQIKAATDTAVKAERDRVAAWMKFHDVDPQAVAAAIASGDTIFESQAVVADLMIKKNDPNRVQAPSAEVTTTEGEGGNDKLKTDAAVSEVEAANAKVLELSGVVTPKTV